jgi:penicillin-binding protein 1A
LTVSHRGVVYKTYDRHAKAARPLRSSLPKIFSLQRPDLTRKVNEWMVALQIERLYTKRQILEMYMNYVFLGAGSYGFEAGSRTYFGKSLKDLNLEEAAVARCDSEIARILADAQSEKSQRPPRHRA